MDDATRIELLSGVERIRRHAVQLFVEAEDLKRRLDGVPPGSGPPLERLGDGPTGGGDDEIEINLSGLKVTEGKVMAVRGYEHFTSLAFDPYIQVKLFHPENLSTRLRPVVEIADLEQTSDLAARLRMLSDAPLATPWIVAPGTTDAVEDAVRGALEGYDDMALSEIRCLGLDDE